jgi:aerotaxis receptor
MATSTATAPAGHEAYFGIDELFFSSTDRKGHIKSGNDVFMRVSGYERGEMIGRAHNVVRHPAMPRAVFKLLWEYLADDRPIAAYVCNRAADGSHYWVMALVMPSQDGYVSVRLKPSSPLFAQARALYEEVHAVEQSIEGGEPRRRKEAIAAGRERLLARLAELGFQSYDDFMNQAFPAEVLSREQALTGGGATKRSHVAAGASRESLAAILDGCATTHDFLEGLVARVEEYDRLGSTLSDKARFVLKLADDIRLFSLNARIAATRLGEAGAALGAVASLMRSRSDSTGPTIESLNKEIVSAVGQLDDMGFRISASKLATEMVMVFVREVIDADHDVEDVAADLDALSYVLTSGIRTLLDALETLHGHLRSVGSHVKALETDLGMLRALEINGRIHAALAGDADGVKGLFASISAHVQSAQDEMAEFENVTRVAAGRNTGEETRVRAEVERVRELLTVAG